MKKHVYFVRHGESNANADGVNRGADAELTEKGTQQAQEVARRIERISLDVIVTSPYIRARDTAHAITDHTGLPLEVSELFAERRNPSEVVGLHAQSDERLAIQKEIEEHYHDKDYHYSDEENMFDLIDRAKRALAYLEERPEESIGVVTHGVFLRVLILTACMEDEATPEIMKRGVRFFRIYNTGITHMELNESGWRILQWNDSAHLG